MMPHISQKLPFLSEHPSSLLVVDYSVLLIFSFMCILCRSLFVLFLLVIVLSVLILYTDSDYPLVFFNNTIIVQVRYIIIEAKEFARIGYNGFLFPHSYSCEKETRLFLLVIVLSVLILYTDSDYPLVSTNLFLEKNLNKHRLFS
jgi:hypothetical protein